MAEKRSAIVGYFPDDIATGGFRDPYLSSYSQKVG